MAAKTITDSPPCFTVGRRAFGLKDTLGSFHTKTRFEVEKRVKLDSLENVISSTDLDTKFFGPSTTS